MPITKSLSTALIDGTGAITPANVTVSTNTMTVGTAMYVVANGNVGIGTATPNKTLYVNGTMTVNTNLIVGTYSLNDVGIRGYSNNSIGVFGGSDSSHGTYGQTNSGYGIIGYSTGSGTAGLIQSDGTGQALYALANTALGARINSKTGDALYVGNVGSIFMSVVANGNMGIGTTTPATKLQVVGSIKGGGLTLNNSNIVSGTNQITVDYLSGTDRSRILAWGSNTITKGTLALGVVSSDASSYVEPIIIDSNGYVGLTVSPSSLYKVMIAGESRGFQVQASTNQTISRFDDNSLACSLKLRNLAMTANAHGIGVFFELSRDGANAYNAGYIASISEDIYSSTASTQDSSLVFATTQNGGTTQRMTLDSVGRVTVPQQPYCRVVSSAGNVTIVSGNQVVPYNSALSNIGSYFNTSTYRFTMPVTGKYLVTASIEVNGGSAQYYNLYVRVNGSGQFGTFQTGSGASYQQFSTNGVVYGNATDYIDVALFAVTGSGTLECSGDTRCSLSITLLS